MTGVCLHFEQFNANGPRHEDRFGHEDRFPGTASSGPLLPEREQPAMFGAVVPRNESDYSLGLKVRSILRPL